MYALFIAFCATVFLLVAALAFREWLADKWADYASRSPELSMADIKALPETTAFDKPDLPRARLRSVPVAPSLSLVPDPVADDIEWVFAADLFVPEQRKPGNAS